MSFFSLTSPRIVKPDPRICIERLNPAFSDSKTKIKKVSAFITAAHQEVEITPLSPQPTSNTEDHGTEEDLFKTPIPSQTRRSLTFSRDEAISTLAEKIHLLTAEINNLSQLNESLIKEVQFWKAAYEKKAEKFSKKPAATITLGSTVRSDQVFKKQNSKTKDRPLLDYNDILLADPASKNENRSNFWYKKFENTQRELVVYKGLYLNTISDCKEDKINSDDAESVAGMLQNINQMRSQISDLVRENERLSRAYNSVSDEVQYLKIKNPSMEERDEFIKGIIKKASESQEERENSQTEEISRLKYEINCLRCSLDNKLRKNLNNSTEMGIPEERDDCIYLEEVIDQEILQLKKKDLTGQQKIEFLEIENKRLESEIESWKKQLWSLEKKYQYKELMNSDLKYAEEDMREITRKLKDENIRVQKVLRQKIKDLEGRIATLTNSSQLKLLSDCESSETSSFENLSSAKEKKVVELNLSSPLESNPYNSSPAMNKKTDAPNEKALIFNKEVSKGKFNKDISATSRSESINKLYKITSKIKK